MLREHVDNGLIEEAICLAEVDMGYNMLHMYAGQHLRGACCNRPAFAPSRW